MTEFNGLPIRLLPINPRYTSFQSINFKKLEFENYDENRVARDLLKYEGNFEDLLELIEGISKNGFLYLNDRILAHSDTKNKNYYVLEGNRRLLSVKLINGETDFESNISKKGTLYSSEGERKNNIAKIKEIIKNYDKKIDVKDEWFLDVSNEEPDAIWQAIYSKHVGEQVGKRNWSRAKYFDDLLKMYKNFLILFRNSNDTKSETVKELSKLFGKKEGIIKSDIKSAIWIIKSIEIYNDFHKDQPVDLKNIEVSGYELVLGKKLVVNGSEKKMREILGIKINEQEIKIEYSEKIKPEKFKKIINFLVEGALSKKITTREIKNEDKIYDDLGELIGHTLTKKKSLNFLYDKLSQKGETQKLTKLERVQLQALKNLKSSPIDPNQFVDQEHDSKFIKSIKYIIRNDLKTLSNLRLFNQDEYPFTNVAHAIRSIIDLFLLEIVLRINMDIFIQDLNIKEKEAKNLRIIKQSYNDSKKHNVNKVTSVFSGCIMSQGSTKVRDVLLSNLDNEYGNQLKKLGIDIKSEVLKASFLKLLNFKKFDSDASNNFALLNGLVHKPYYGFENAENINLIDNLNIMFSTVKEFITLWKIWNNN